MKIIFKTIFIIIICSALFASNLGDYVAKFDPELAIDIYQNEIHRNGRNSLYLPLARMYQKTGNIKSADSCYQIYRAMDQNVDREYISFLFDSGKYHRLQIMADSFHIPENEKTLILAKSSFFRGEFTQAYKMSSYLDNLEADRIMELSEEAMNLSYRSPLLAAGMSALIPGSGKMYAGRWLDGLQALTVVVMPAFNAYYHFKKYGYDGWDSVRGWIWCGSAVWFYLSDIYGTVKAVKQYNRQLQEKIIRRFDL